MAGQIALDTTGLKEALAGMDRLARLDASRDLKTEFNKIAQDAADRGRAGASTRLERRAASTLRAASTGTAAAVGYGKGFAAAFGAEFGASQNTLRQRRTGSYLGYNQFKPHAGRSGYFMWPGIRAAADAGVDNLADAVVKIIEGAR